MKVNKIQILIPGGGFYGGIESLHQLAYQLKKMSYNTEVVYIPLYNKLGTRTKFKKNNNLNNYNINISKNICDEENVLVVVPETFTGYLNSLKNSKVAIWWLSVDNYFKKKISQKKIQVILANIIFKITKNKKLLHYLNQISLDELKKKNIFHFAQSDYSIDFLKKNKFKNILPLKDYIFTRINNIKKNKQYDVVLNSQKGNKHNLELISNYNDVLKIITLKNYSLKTSQEKLYLSKLFVDFGNHPGRDRMPREMINSKSNVYVHSKGAANFYTDVHLPNKFKFKKVDQKTYFSIIQFILLNDKNFLHKNYLNKIKKDENIMVKQIKKIIKKINYEN